MVKIIGLAGVLSSGWYSLFIALLFGVGLTIYHYGVKHEC